MPAFAQILGLLRSLAIYYGRPDRFSGQRRFYAQFVRAGDLVFDIGAHVGSRARILHRIGAQVVAVEPQPFFAGFLRRTLPRTVVFREVALGAEKGKAEMRISHRHPTVSTSSGDWIHSVGGAPGFERVNWNASCSVEKTTLDDMIAQHGRPRFCKIDVEGGEADVLLGLSQPLPWVSFEYLPAVVDRAATCIDILSRLGPYSFNRVTGEQSRFVSPAWKAADEMREELLSLKQDAGSGDIYARLESEGAGS